MQRTAAIGRRAALMGLAVAGLTGGAAWARQAGAALGTASDIRPRTLTEMDIASHQGRAYRLIVSAPTGDPPPNGFPVIYVLDGHAWVGTAVEVARMRERSKLDPPVIVGIGYPSRRFFDPARTYDFTPPGVKDDRFDGAELGGAGHFIEFLDRVVRPQVAGDHAVSADRQALFGHSLGGLCVLQALFSNPRGFSHFIAASPSVGFGDRAIVKAAAGFRAPAGATPRLLVTMGGLEVGIPQDLAADYLRWYEAHPEAREGQTAEEAVADTFPAADVAYDRISEARAMTTRLATAGVRAVWAEFPGEEHTAAAISALNRGVPFALRPAA